MGGAMSDSLLPHNATAQEQSLTSAIKPDFAVDIRDLWSPQRCPADFLPYLAQEFSVDRWDNNWSEAAKRAAIEAAFFVHKHKGTKAAIRRVVEPFGYLIKVDEWWQKQPQEKPYTFSLAIGLTDRGLTSEIYQQMVTLIEDAKPLRSSMIGLDLQAETRGDIYCGTGCYCGDLTDVYPYAPGVVSVTGQTYFGAGQHIIDDVSVYPL